MNVEFSLCPNGDLLIHDGSSVRTYCEEDSKITDELYAVIERDYPEAFSALQSLYRRSIGKHGQTDPVRTVQIDPFKTA